MRFLSVLLAVAGIDQLVKWLVRLYLPLNNPVPILDNFFFLTYVSNHGAAFGLFQGMVPVFIGAAIVVLTGIAAFVFKMRPHRLVEFALACISGGAAGNLIDRAVHGGVIDYLDFRVWPVFNFADVAIVTGSILILIVLVHEERSREG